jgi:3-methyladenine DNA glycosylase AlkD
MRDQFPFLGLPAPRQRALARTVLAGLDPPGEADLRAVALACWALPEREFQYFACDWLRRHAAACSAGFVDTARYLLTTKPWWDTVDALAAHLVGPLVRRHPSLLSTMDSWAADEDMWLVRTAILHQLTYQAATDTDRLFGYCAAQAGHRDFFIRNTLARICGPTRMGPRVLSPSGLSGSAHVTLPQGRHHGPADRVRAGHGPDPGPDRTRLGPARHQVAEGMSSINQAARGTPVGGRKHGRIGLRRPTSSVDHLRTGQISRPDSAPRTTAIGRCHHGHRGTPSPAAPAPPRTRAPRCAAQPISSVARPTARAGAGQSAVTNSPRTATGHFQARPTGAEAWWAPGAGRSARSAPPTVAGDADRGQQGALAADSGLRDHTEVQ